jgi:hypothetical protein
VTIQQETRAPFTAHTTKSDKRHAGRTEGAGTPLEIRTVDHGIEETLRAWIYERVGRQLGKYAPQIERIQLRFGDDNGTRGGIDRCCMVHVVLSKLPPVVVEMRGSTDREAFDLAARSAERAVRRNLEKHGYSMHNGRHGRANGHAEPSKSAAPHEAERALDGARDEVAHAASEDSLFGKRVGHGQDRLLLLAARPEKLRRDAQVDTSEPGVSADARKIGYGHTGKRNTKLNTAGMTRSLEDSTTDRPSRKSTRGSSNHVKADSPLTLRTRDAVRSAKSVAGRVAARGR